MQRVARDPLLVSGRYRRALAERGYEADQVAALERENEGLRAALRSAEAELRSAQGEQQVPGPVRAWERLYDSRTGGWRCAEPLLDNPPFVAEVVDAWTREYQERPLYWAVELEVGRFYYWFVRLTRPQYVLETGTNGGYSTSMLGAALKTLGHDGRLLSLDLVRMHHLFAATEVADVVQFVEADTAVVDPTSFGCPHFDLLVLDSGHHYGCIATELQRFEPHLKAGGYMLLHDSLYFDGVGLAVEQLMRNPRFEIVTLDTPRTHGRPGSRSPGLTVVRKNLADDGRHPFTPAPSLHDVNVHRGAPPAVEGTGPAYLDAAVRPLSKASD
jgi:predicted O-methyltransferase YrrM